jgi:hypothetical protein
MRAGSRRHADPERTGSVGCSGRLDDPGVHGAGFHDPGLGDAGLDGARPVDERQTRLLNRIGAPDRNGPAAACRYGFAEPPPGFSWFGDPTPPSEFAGDDGFGFGSGEHATSAATARASRASSTARGDGTLMPRLSVGAAAATMRRAIGPGSGRGGDAGGDWNTSHSTVPSTRVDSDTTVRFRRTAPSQGRDAGAASGG